MIDPHYQEKHRDSVDDKLILKLVLELNGRFEVPDMRKGRYSYFATLVTFGLKKLPPDLVT